MNYETEKIVKKDKNSNKNILENNSNINGKILILIKQHWEKIELEYNSLMKKLEKFNHLFINTEIQKVYKSMISLFNNFKSNFKNIFVNLGKNIGNLSNDKNNDNKLNNDSITKNILYDNINNECSNLESIIKDINNIQIKNKKKRKKQIENLENKLHEYMDEVDKFDFNKINKLYDNFNNNKNGIENIILQNDYIEQYNYKEFEENENNDCDNNDEKNINDIMNINTLNHESESIYSENKNSNKIIDGIINMGEINKDNAIKYIQSLIKKEKNNEKNNVNN